jgi:hypothetical protein
MTGDVSADAPAVPLGNASGSASDRTEMLAIGRTCERAGRCRRGLLSCARERSVRLRLCPRTQRLDRLRNRVC